MKKQIEYLLFCSGVTNYQIAKSTGISQVVLSKYSTGKSDVGKMTLDNAEKLYQFYEEMVKMAENKFGAVKFEGRRYTLLDQADFSGRQLLDWQAEEGYAHFVAPAIDAEGNQYEVEWIQCLRREDGSEIEDLSDLNWDEVDNVRVI